MLLRNLAGATRAMSDRVSLARQCAAPAHVPATLLQGCTRDAPAKEHVFATEPRIRRAARGNLSLGRLGELRAIGWELDPQTGEPPIDVCWGRTEVQRRQAFQERGQRHDLPCMCRARASARGLRSPCFLQRGAASHRAGRRLACRCSCCTLLRSAGASQSPGVGGVVAPSGGVVLGSGGSVAAERVGRRTSARISGCDGALPGDRATAV